MTALLIVSLLIDTIALFYFYREGFVVRSNKSAQYKRRFAMMLGVMAAAGATYGLNPFWACLIAGIPAGLTLLVVAFFAVIFLSHKGPWR